MNKERPVVIVDQGEFWSPFDFFRELEALRQDVPVEVELVNHEHPDSKYFQSMIIIIPAK